MLLASEPTTEATRRTNPGTRRGPDSQTRAVLPTCRSDSGPAQLLGGAEHGDPVPDRHHVVASRAGHRGRPVGRHHGHGGQGPEQCPQRRIPLHLDLAGHEPGAPQLDLEGIAAQTGLDDGGCGQRGHVEHGAGSGDLGDRRSHGGIGQLHHHPDVGPQLADEQGGLQGLDLGALGTDDGPGPGQPRLFEDAADPGIAHDEGDVPRLDHPDQTRIGLVFDHHHLHPGLVELLDHPQTDALEAADDDVALPLPLAVLLLSHRGSAHPVIVPHLHFLPIAGMFRARAGHEPRPGPGAPVDPARREREYTFDLSVDHWTAKFNSTVLVTSGGTMDELDN